LEGGGRVFGIVGDRPGVVIPDYSRPCGLSPVTVEWFQGLLAGEVERVARETDTRLDLLGLKWCNGQLCERMTSAGAAFCCDPCSRAADGGYEIHEGGPLGHAGSCGERWAGFRAAGGLS
jgi:hypothetical protein